MPRTDASENPYQTHLFDRLPLYSTRLVREAEFIYPDRFQVTNPEGGATILHDYFADKDREEFLLVLLDTANTVISLSQISVGGSSSIVEPRQVFKTAILADAAALILAHQHPSGNPEPSQEDIRITRQRGAEGRLLELIVLLLSRYTCVISLIQIVVQAHSYQLLYWTSPPTPVDLQTCTHNY